MDASDAPRPKVDTVPELSAKATIARSVADMLDEVKVKLVVAWTQSGNTARLLSKVRVDVPILSLCPDPLTARQLSLNYGTISICQPVLASYEEWVKRVEEIVEDNRWATKGEHLLLMPPAELLAANTIGALILHTVS